MNKLILFLISQYKSARLYLGFKNADTNSYLVADE